MAGETAAQRLRSEQLHRLRQVEHDVLVVGAGINGAVSAAALGAAGASVALVDRGDFASLTSQETSNLIWGGIKYLENRELGLVRKLCRARNDLMRSFPSRVREMRFLASLERGQGLKRSVPALWLGAWLYWLIGGCFTRRPRHLSAFRIAREEPYVNASIMRGAIEYSDAWLVDNDARFVFDFVQTAVGRGAVALNYVEVLASQRGRGGVWRTRVQDVVSGQEFTIGSRVLVNAAGPYVDALNDVDGVTTRTRHVFSKGIHIIVDRIARKPRVLAFFDDAGRLFFVLPMGHRSVIGTTDVEVEHPRTEVTAEDRRFLLDNINKRLRLPAPLGEDDIVAERCGVRPLAIPRASATGAVDWVALSRKHVLEVDRERRHVSIFGGKLTDGVNVGSEVVHAVQKFGLPVRETPDWYGEPSAERREAFEREADRMGIDRRPDVPAYEALSARLWRRYGETAFGMLEEIARDPRQGERVIEGAEYRRCEIEHIARSERVVTLEDFLRRRSKIALLRSREELRQSRGLMEACEILFGDEAGARWDRYFASAGQRRAQRDSRRPS